jgi:DNA-binding CsgD family transcriptional regulator
MPETLLFRANDRPAPWPAPGLSVLPGYGGPERRTASSLVWRWMVAALDEVDYGILLLDEESRTLHVNHAASDELDAQHPLMRVGRELRARHARDVQPLQLALHGAAQRGLRKLLTVGEGAKQVSVSVVPLGPQGRDQRRATMVMLGKRQVCAELAVQGFARCHRLSPGETTVLTALCRGARPVQIAADRGVAMSTVRSQISSIRVKTGAASIRALVRQVAVLPPLMGVLREPRGAEWIDAPAALRA